MSSRGFNWITLVDGKEWVLVEIAGTDFPYQQFEVNLKDAPEIQAYPILLEDGKPRTSKEDVAFQFK